MKGAESKHWSNYPTPDFLYFQFFSKNPDVERVLLFFFVAIKPEYRGKSIATQLIKIAIDHTTKIPTAPCQAIQVFASNPFSRKIFDKFGFKKVEEIFEINDIFHPIQNICFEWQYFLDFFRLYFNDSFQCKIAKDYKKCRLQHGQYLYFLKTFKACYI